MVFWLYPDVGLLDTIWFHLYMRSSSILTLCQTTTVLFMLTLIAEYVYMIIEIGYVEPCDQTVI